MNENIFDHRNVSMTIRRFIVAEENKNKNEGKNNTQQQRIH